MTTSDPAVNAKQSSNLQEYQLITVLLLMRREPVAESNRYVKHVPFVCA
jgi:hypothetical protein